MGLIYLASPYTSEDEEVMRTRYKSVCEYTARLKRAGYYVFSPIAHCHGPAQYGLPKDYEYWQGYCELMIPKCDRVLVLMLDGWEDSKGVEAESKLALSIGMGIIHCDPNKLIPDLD